MLDTKTKKYLRSKAHPLKPVIAIGKNGITAGVIEEIERTARAVELLKIKIHPGAPAAMAEMAALLEEKLPGELIGKTGRILIYFLPGKDQSKYLPPPASPAE